MHPKGHDKDLSCGDCQLQRSLQITYGLVDSGSGPHASITCVKMHGIELVCGRTEDRSCHGTEWSENILSGGRHLIIWPPDNLSGGRHLN